MSHFASIIGCGKAKLATITPVEARNLYIGPLFRARLRYALARSQGSRPPVDPARSVFILSAKHGLISLDQKLLPYDFTITQMAEQRQRSWAFEAMERLLNHTYKCAIIEAHLGESYARPILEAARHFQLDIKRPVRGLSQGKLLAWYHEHQA